jgi:cytochrome c oxidase subunit 2
VPSGSAPAPVGASVIAGRQIYQMDCMSCHGSGGRGGLPVGGAVSADIRWGTLSAQSPPYTDELLKRAILQGLDPAGHPLDKAMPRWQGRLTANQLADLVAYLHTLR